MLHHGATGSEPIDVIQEVRLDTQVLHCKAFVNDFPERRPSLIEIESDSIREFIRSAQRRKDRKMVLSHE
jgi:hypothetical protein